MSAKQELINVAKAMPQVFGDLNECVYCRVIFMSRYGVKFKARHKRNCHWAKLRRAIKRAEATR